VIHCKHAFSLYLGGGEVPWFRSRMEEAGAAHVSINFLQLRKERMPKSGLWSVAQKFPDTTEVLADGGGRSKTEVDHEDHLAAYLRWLEVNADRLTMAIEYDPAVLGIDWMLERRHLYDDLGELFVPVWHEEHGFDALEHLAEHYPRVAITAPSDAVAGRLRALVGRTGVMLHGLAITGPDDLSSLPLATAGSTSWISPGKYGETHVWAGGRFHWYPASSSTQARQRHRHDIEQAGFDAEAYLAGDKKEIARYSIWSWGRLEESIGAQRTSPDAQIVAIRGRVATSETAQEEGDSVAISEHTPRKYELVVREPEKHFPGMAQRAISVEKEQEDGEVAVEILQLPALASSGLRRCSSCSLQARCPEFTPEATCAFNFGVEIKTKAQLDSALSAILETQFQRVAFARANEEADGNIINLDVSKEMDLFLKMVERVRDIQTDQSVFQVTAKGSGVGLVSALMAAAGGGGPQRAQVPLAPTRGINPQRAEELLGEIIDVTPEDS
jgi:hypothetical protein